MLENKRKKQKKTQIKKETNKKKSTLYKYYILNAVPVGCALKFSRNTNLEKTNNEIEKP